MEGMGDMENLAGKVMQDRNSFEQLLLKIPGFQGYLNKELRRETDKLLREFLAKKVDELRARLDPVMRELVDGGGLMVVNEVDRVKKGMEKIVSRLRYAKYGYTGLFDVVKVREAELDRLYQFDMALIERIEGLEKAVAEVSASVSDHLNDHQQLKAATRSAMDLCREFDEHYNNRERMICQPPAAEL